MYYVEVCGFGWIKTEVYVAERESFTSSVFAVFYGHNIILYREPVP